MCRACVTPRTDDQTMTIIALTDLSVGVKILLRWSLKIQCAWALDTRHSHILLNLKIHYCALKGR